MKSAGEIAEDEDEAIGAPADLEWDAQGTEGHGRERYFKEPGGFRETIEKLLCDGALLLLLMLRI